MSICRLLIVAGLLPVVVAGCHSGEVPVPFKARIAGFAVEFPASAEKLYRQGYRRRVELASAYEKSTDTTDIVWFMNYADTREETDQSKTWYSYGASISLKNKGDQFEEVKRRLEKQFGKRFTPMVMTHATVSWAQQHPGYRLDLNPSTTLFIRKANAFAGDYWSEYNTVRIAIGYNLTESQQEYFAITSQQIKEDD